MPAQMIGVQDAGTQWAARYSMHSGIQQVLYDTTTDTREHRFSRLEIGNWQLRV